MKAVITGERTAGLKPMDELQPQDDWVVVKVVVAPMCAEYKQFVRGERTEFAGHEAAGEVVAVDRPTHVAPGDRVVAMPLYSCGECWLCRRGDYIHCERDSIRLHRREEGSATMAEYLLKPDRLLVPIPDGVSYEHGAMACCGLGASFGALERLAVTGDDTLLITGLGPVGLGGVINARFRGTRVIGVEANPLRADLARTLGADLVVDPTDPDAVEQVRAATGGRGPDKAVDCSGIVSAHRLCIAAVRRQGAIAFVGESWAETPVVVSDDLIRKGLTLIGSWHYPLYKAPKLMDQIAQIGPQLDRLITHEFPLARVQDAWETQASGRCGKVILRP
jgi:L-iditol 2-dehydrogenase